MRTFKRKEHSQTCQSQTERGQQSKLEGDTNEFGRRGKGGWRTGKHGYQGGLEKKVKVSKNPICNMHIVNTA